MSFNQMSFWDQQSTDPVFMPTTPASPEPRQVDNRKLEDWSLRVEQAAHAAEDAGDYDLGRELLDLRDEIANELHQRMLG